ncbi:Alpha-galactosidase, NEW1 domain-containing protein [Caldithrix abyssi DSM 13497]|uniref:Alpha-galactosidase n=1 Tax=Caldithrix abyssi DSM 13497 TaxID=880073 RepID=H1XWZ7_CALAY|nr:Alpha-galactosidase, NEW1 domain-containing protein [Caldithrix abyssi DSM 13497]
MFDVLPINFRKASVRDAKKIFSLVFLFLFPVLTYGQSPTQDAIQINSGWKFLPKDDLAFARPDYDDSNWKNIRVDKSWDKQGYQTKAGFGWYRIKVIIPSSLKENAFLKDSLIFNLGKIDDFDQVFLNGALIGENGKNVGPNVKAQDSFKDLENSFWNVERHYSLAVDDARIQWDRENVLAIRVYNWGGPGGIYSGNLSISMPYIGQYLRVELNKGLFTVQNQKMNKKIALHNTAGKYPIKGTLQITATDNIASKELFSKSYSLDLKPKGRMEITFDFPEIKRSTTIHYVVRFENSDRPLVFKEGAPYILTPPEKPQPQINYPRVYGQRTGKPFLFRIPVSGQRPIRITARGLPSGLTLDVQSGIISGKVDQQGVYHVKITARNALGEDRATLKIVIGNQIALTPPMGWNSWNVWGLSVTQERVYAAARAFVEKGLVNHGWQFVNIDDGWEIIGSSDEAKRHPNGEIRTNKKFPDIKRLADDIHALGLKLGIYSSPGPLTCGGYTASYGYEELDAQTFARWGVDFLKYDLCSYRKMMKDLHSAEELIPPYKKMNQALQKVDRDIVYSICEYGLGKVWEWGARVGGNLWRTTGDIWDDWERMASIGFNQEQAAPYAGPGHWNDPDMLVVGWVGWGDQLHYTKLTPDEQYTHISLWALLSAPLLLGCDLQRLDDFTLNLLTNDEVLAVNQDPLGKQAVPIIKAGDIHVYKKELADGNVAIGIFNLGKETKTYSLNLRTAGVEPPCKIRDLWRQKDLGSFKSTFDTIIPEHGVTLVKIFKEE